VPGSAEADSVIAASDATSEPPTRADEADMPATEASRALETRPMDLPCILSDIDFSFPDLLPDTRYKTMTMRKILSDIVAQEDINFLLTNRIPRATERELVRRGYPVKRSPLTFHFAGVHGIRIVENGIPKAPSYRDLRYRWRDRVQVRTNRQCLTSDVEPGFC
jgi:hypothetical protein